MSLVPGTRLGPYEVIGPLGAGGMGEVFKARDTRLERSVAIKILPAELAQNAQLKLRFEREAKAISQLTHPNICTLYDVGDGYLVMELLDGETLADRIAKGPLPLDQLIRIGTEIANALDRAHKAGIIHRDLKPSNVMLTKSGAKLLDFGLAKSGGQAPAPVLGTTMQKPLTEEGTLLGTFQYMAPEQLEGAEADARTDIFALGSVLYEMTTGKSAFQGRSRASLIANILGADPLPITTIQPMAPATLDRVIRKCLEKDPDARWQCAHDVATALQWSGDTPQLPAPARAARRWIPWTIAALLAGAVAGLAWYHFATLRNAPIVRTTILPPDKTEFVLLNDAAPPAISPDGTKIVFGAAEPGKQRVLWIRSLDALAPQPLAATENASFPFWSPDGRNIAFFTNGTLKKMELGGGAPVVLCNVLDGRGGSWSDDGRTIVFAGRYTPIYRVSSAGGTPVEVTKLTPQATSHRWPQFLPGSKHFLFLASPSGSEDAANAICVGAVDGSIQKPLIAAANDPHYFGHSIIYARDRILTAQPFDEKKLALAGDAFPLKEQQVEFARLFSRTIVDVSRAGTLVYQPSTSSGASLLNWFDRSGKPMGSVSDPGPYNMLSLSPDAKSLLVSISGSPQNIWSFDLVRNVKTRITFNDGIDSNPLWMPDGRRMVYTAFGGGKFRIVQHDLTTGAEETLVEGPASGAQAFGVPVATSFSPDGERLLLTKAGSATRGDIYWLSLSDRKLHPYVVTPFIETGARFSPDGKWVAYMSNEAGPSEVYIAPFPPNGAKWQVSTTVGVVPHWRGDGKELYFVVPSTNTMMAVPVTLGATPQIGEAVKLFTFHIGVAGTGMYDVTHDGQRFVINVRPGDDVPAAPLVVVQHFDRELRDALDHRD